VASEWVVISLGLVFVLFGSYQSMDHPSDLMGCVLVMHSCWLHRCSLCL